jgi:hypothetical protein
VGIVPGHEVFSVEGVAEFVQSFVYGSFRFADVHEEVFAGRTNAVEAWSFIIYERMLNNIESG